MKVPRATPKEAIPRIPILRSLMLSASGHSIIDTFAIESQERDPGETFPYGERRKRISGPSLFQSTSDFGLVRFTLGSTDLRFPAIWRYAMNKGQNRAKSLSSVYCSRNFSKRAKKTFDLRERKSDEE